MKNNQQFRNNIILLIGFALIGQLSYSQTIENLYVNMPDFLNPTLSKQNRFELLEYHKAHLSDSTTNRFENQTSLVLMDTVNEHIVVKNTAVSSFDMKLLTLEDSTLVIGIIRTVCAPVC